MRAFAAITVIFGATVLCVTEAGAVTYTVTSSADDSAAADFNCTAAACTLRQAMNAVQHAPGTDTIVIPASITDIQLTQGPFSFNGNISLTVTSNAPGRTTLHAASNSQILTADFQASQLTLANLRFTGGRTTDVGGAVKRGGNSTNQTTTITNCVFDDNQSTQEGGGLYVEGSLIISHSTFTNNHADNGSGGGAGGGFYQGDYAVLTISDSSFTDNSAGSIGGGFFESADQGGAGTITDTLLARNSVGSTATAGTQGGGAAYIEEPVTMRNVTVFGNVTASQGGGPEDAALDVPDQSFFNNVTIAGNHSRTSSLHVIGPSTNAITVSNSIIVGETTTCTGTMSSLGNNLLGTGCVAVRLASDSGADPKLATVLAPTLPTQTLPLLVNSPAIDKGNNATCEDHDQRHLARPQGPACDIGAYEAQPAADVSIKKTSSANPVQGQSISYTLEISNAGPAAASAVTVMDSLPASLTNCTVQSGACTIAGSVVTCTLASLGASVSTSVVFSCTAGQAGALTNSATVTHGEPDPNSGNDQATDTTTVAVPPSPSCPKTGPCDCTAVSTPGTPDPLTQSCITAVANGSYTANGFANKNVGCAQTEPSWTLLAALGFVCTRALRRRRHG